MTPIDEYLKNVTPTQKATLEHIRKIIKQVVPDAEEAIGYGIPAFKVKGRSFTYFAAFKDHMSLYPLVSDEVRQKLGKYKLSKGTIQFTEDNPIPDPLLKEIIKDHLKRMLSAYKK